MTQLTLYLLAAISIVELLIWFKPFWGGRRFLAGLVIASLPAVTGYLVANYLTVWSVLILALSVYRLVNLFRLQQQRLQAHYLYHATRQAAVWLIGLQLVLVGLAAFSQLYHVDAMTWLYALALGQLLAALVIAKATFRNLKTTRPPRALKGMADRDLPSLTVAIPARNETTELEACLRSLIASNYPKLEILVLDDSSQNKHTPEIIRSFAHDGVRFVAGETPPRSWLPKNFAYDRLADEANGEIILFCGVDTRFEAGSLTQLVKTLLQKHKTMISILPYNVRPKTGLMSLIVQPSRYAWEMALPRRFLNRPPVLSTCWLITKEALFAAGGFEAVRRKCIPESYFARQIARQSDGYSFLQADDSIGITSHKQLDEQHSTAIRTRYPQLHKRPELVCLTGLAELAVLLWPLGNLLIASLTQEWLLAVLSGMGYIIQAFVFSRIVNLTYRQRLWQGWLLLPLAVIHDIRLLNYSMWQYEFGQVLWKGRNVTVPIMQVIPRLPKI